MSATEWTTEQWVEHGREWLVAGWVWKPGQVAIVFDRAGVLTAVVAHVVDGKPYFHETLPDKSGTIWTWSPCTWLDAVPYLRDPGTRGHALEQDREHWSDPGMTPALVGRIWTIRNRSGDLISGPHGSAFLAEHEALLAARRAAP